MSQYPDSRESTSGPEPRGETGGDRSGPPSDADRRRRRPRTGRFPRRKVCPFCVQKMEYIDYKDVIRLRRFLSDRGKIFSRRITGACAKHQRGLTTAIKRARNIALLPYKGS